MRRAVFSSEGLVEVEFFEAQSDVGAMMVEHDKQLERLIRDLPADVKEQIIKKRNEDLAYASSV